MDHIKEDLKDLVENTMIPEVESYLEDLHKLLEAKSQTPDDMLAHCLLVDPFPCVFLVFLSHVRRVRSPFFFFFF